MKDLYTLKDMAKCFILLYITALIMLVSEEALAGAWVKKPGHGFVSTAYTYYRTSSEYNSDGKNVRLSNDGEYQKHSISSYLEYGLTERVTMTGSVNYDYLTYEDEGTNSLKQHGFSDQRLGVRYLCYEEPLVISFQETVKIPAGYDDNKDLPLGNTQVDLESCLLFGKSIGRDRYLFYANLEVGYVVRLDAPPDAVKWQTLLGYKGIKNTEISIAWNATRSIGSGEETPVAKNVLALVDYDLDRIDLSASYAIAPEVSIFIDYFNHVGGKNTGSGDGFASGVAVSW